MRKKRQLPARLSKRRALHWPKDERALRLLGILALSAFFAAVSFSPSNRAQAGGYAYPVPFISGTNDLIRFRDVPSEGTIRIFDVAGEKVVELTIAPGENPKAWDVRNSQGDKVAPGVYHYEIEGDGTKTFGKLIVVR